MLYLCLGVDGISLKADNSFAKFTKSKYKKVTFTQ